jgi:Zn-finger nucleic acid-binding protein
MRCPKCGGRLSTQEFHKLQIDSCPDCHGVWLDAGEIEAVMALEERGFMTRALGEFFGSLRGKQK